MATLTEIQNQALTMENEIYRATACSGLQIETDEVREFLLEVADADADPCDACGLQLDAARAFVACISESKPHLEGTAEALALLLDESGVCRDRWEARRYVQQFIDLAQQPERVPPCAASMGCLCAGHARGNDADAPCDTQE